MRFLKSLLKAKHSLTYIVLEFSERSPSAFNSWLIKAKDHEKHSDHRSAGITRWEVGLRDNWQLLSRCPDLKAPYQALWLVDFLTSSWHIRITTFLKVNDRLLSLSSPIQIPLQKLQKPNKFNIFVTKKCQYSITEIHWERMNNSENMKPDSARLCWPWLTVLIYSN